MDQKVYFPQRCRWMFVLLGLALVQFTWAQRTISGTITDASSGEPLIGANILAVGTSSGTVTDLDGSFTLDVPSGVTQLAISYTGYTSQTVDLGASDVVDIALQPGSVLEEIVVTGYGTVKRKDLTGAVASLDEKDFNQGLVVAPDQLIQGRTPGVQVINNSGQPGGATTIRIRGNASIRTGNQPLFVVDGVQLSGVSSRPGGGGLEGNDPGGNPLNYLNPNDIASIEVLKDATAAAIYGSRGANGVILITTKRGQSGAPLISFNANVGFNTVANKYDVLDGNEYRAALQEYNLTGGDFGDDVDAFDEITRTGLIQQYNMSVSGGTDDGRYRVSVGYFSQDGVIKNNNLTRINANIGGNFKFTKSKRIGLDFNLIASRTLEDAPAITTSAGFRGSLIGNALQWNPTHRIYEENGDPVIIPEFGNFTNPVALLDAYDDQIQTTDIVGSIAPYVKILDNLTYTFQYAVNTGIGQRRFDVDRFINLQDIENRGFAGINGNSNIRQIFTNTLQWNEQFGSLGLDFLLGYEYQLQQGFGFGLSARDFILDVGDYYNFIQNSSQASRSIGSGAAPDEKLQSFFGRFNFNFNEQFLLTAVVRADGSSKFGENNRYGVFPSFAFAWNMHNSWATFADNFKLRLGWGQVGNSSFPAGASQERWFLGDEGTFGLANVANPDLKWETTTTWNAAIDFSLFDFRLNGTVEYFYRNTTDLLFQFPTIQPAPAGFYWINLDGNVINSGLEITLDATVIQAGKFTWQLGGNVSFLDNELRNYDGPNTPYGTLFGQGATGAFVHRLANNTPLNAFWLRGHLGLDDQGLSEFETDEEGNQVFAYRGNPNPSTLLGIFTQLTLGQFSLVMNFNGTFGNDVFNNTQMTVIPIGNLGSRNIDANLLGTGEAIANPITASDRYLESGNFFRFANFTLGWNFGTIGSTVSRGQLFITGTNLFNITNYTGFDPEVNTVNDSNGLPSFGIEYIPYPAVTSLLFGVRFAL